MNSPYWGLPPLGALVGFEAAARLGSFSLAAEEMNMTQSAISHQIKTLETHLDQPLFRRINRRVELTDAGRDFHTTAESALEAVRQGVRRLTFYTKPGSVVLMMPPSLATGWFLPRLPAFVRRHPGVEPWLFTSDAESVDFDETEIDIAITRQTLHGDDLVDCALPRDRLHPMCAPGLLPAGKVNIDVLETMPLLHDESEDDWQKWFARARLTRSEFAGGLNFSDQALMLNAAARGLGVCLGSVLLAEQLIEEGRLVRIGDIDLPASRPYVCTAHSRHLARPAVTALWEYLQEQGFRQDMEGGFDTSVGKKQAD